jgi:putative transposase
MAFIGDMPGPRGRVDLSSPARAGPSGRRADLPGRQTRPAPAARTVSDAVLVDALITTRNTPEGLYGRKKMTHDLRRCDHQVASCTVDRLMGELGMNGIRRGKRVRTTVSARDGTRAGDLLDREFTASAPNTRWVADFT